MASYISVPCPKFPSLIRNGATRGVAAVSHSRVSLQGHKERKFHNLMVKAHEATVDGSSNCLPMAAAKTDNQSHMHKDDKAEEEPAMSDSAISAFMSEVSNLVKLVDSRDITELQLKQKDCELIIRKKEALQPVAPAAPVVMMQPPQGVVSAQPQPTPSAPPPSAPVPALPPAKESKSSLPPLKCPMAGTFYRSPGPGEPAFVKVGDKVKKGQVVCIIEAMKLMNEIEADHSGTIVEIVAEDGKPVSVDSPLLIIAP
nr:biotin carboxyl carrier protein of acetyl-CoA carboxylase 1 [Erycina pusilla]